MKLSVVLPTRGLIFTEVMEQLEKIRHTSIRMNETVDMHIFFSKDLGIPDALKTLVDRALAINPEYLLFIEEDTVPPDEALRFLVNAEADVAFIDYSVNGWACSATYTTGEILWCGLGCTLVRASVFQELPRPYFRTDKSLSLNEETYFQWKDIPNKYGGQDIWFFTQVREAGFSLVKVSGECRHLRLVSLARLGVNNGRHVIAPKPTIVNYKKYEKPLTSGRSVDDNVHIGNLTH